MVYVLLAVIAASFCAVTHAGQKSGLCALHLSVGRPVLFTPLQHAQFVARQSVAVRIDEARLEEVAKELERDGVLRTAVQHAPALAVEGLDFDARFAFLLALSAIDYANPDLETRAFSAATASRARRLRERGGTLSAPGALARIEERQVAEVWGATINPADLGTCVRHLRAVGEFLDRNRGKDWRAWLGTFPRALDLALFVARNVPGFDDPFVQRAQLFTKRLIATSQENSAPLARTLRAEDLTLSADSLRPRGLERMGILHYAPELARKIAEGQILRAGSPFEVEIRAATVHAGEKLLRALKEIRGDHAVDAVALDAAFEFWGSTDFDPLPGRLFINPARPPHRSVTTDY